MTDIGVVAKRINSTKGTLTITNTTTTEYLFLQDVRIPLVHVEYREPTTSAGPIYFSGQPNNRLSGTCIMSTDAWALANTGITALTTRTNGEVPIVTLVYKTTGADGSTLTFTWTNGAKCEGTTPMKSPEGGHKFEISFILIGDAVVS